MSLQNKMDIDNIWLKSSIKDEDPYKRSFGHLYLNEKDINYREQLEMSYRTMGKLYDWDLEKFRLDKNHIDRTNKKRFHKNFARVVKNPLGYIGWKFLIHTNIPRIFGFGIFATLFVEFFIGTYESDALKQKMNWYVAQGNHVNGTGTQEISPQNRKLPLQKTRIFSYLYSYPNATYFVTNPADKQNFRLHLEMMKKHNKLNL